MEKIGSLIHVLFIIFALIGIFVASKLLAIKLSIAALLLLLISTTVFFAALIIPLIRRKGRKKSGLPSRYERVEDPWRSLDKGKDPTQKDEI